MVSIAVIWPIGMLRTVDNVRFKEAASQRWMP